MEMYTLNLDLHRSNLTFITARSYRAAQLLNRWQSAEQAKAARAVWRADVAAEAVAAFYFYDSYTGTKK